MNKRHNKYNDERAQKKKKVTPLLLPKKRSLSGPPKKRVRKNDEIQTILPKEKEIISSFSRELTPRTSLRIGHKLGRKATWVKNQQKNLILKKKVILPPRSPLLSELLKVKGKNNRILTKVSKGCDLFCKGSGVLVTCPSCERFQFHLDCLQKMLVIFKMPAVDVAQKWKCPHC